MTGGRAGLTVGAIGCVLVPDGGMDYPLDIIEGLPAQELDRLVGGRIDGNTIYLPYNAMLVRTRDSTVLVDAGLGQLAGQLGVDAGHLFDGLRAAGAQPPEVDVVVLTHAHPDHVGGLTLADGEGRSAAFPKARHLLSRAEWEFWMGEPAGLPPHLADLMVGVARTHLPALDECGLVELVDRETEVAPGVWVVPAPGHTPGHLAVALESEGESALFLSDAVLDDFHLQIPDWSPHVDVQGDVAALTRRRLLDRAATEGCLVAAYHMGRIGHVERADGSYRLV